MRKHVNRRTVGEAIRWRHVNETEVTRTGLIQLLLQSKEPFNTPLGGIYSIQGPGVYGAVVDADPGEEKRVLGGPGRPVGFRRKMWKKLMLDLTSHTINSVSTNGIVIDQRVRRAMYPDLLDKVADPIRLAWFTPGVPRKLNAKWLIVIWMRGL